MAERKWPLTAHLLLMFALSLIIAYSFSAQLVPDKTIAYKGGYLFGRGLGSVLIPIILVAIPAGIHRLFKHQRFPHYIPTLWAAWLVVIGLSTYGSAVFN